MSLSVGVSYYPFLQKGSLIAFYHLGQTDKMAYANSEDLDQTASEKEV